MKRREVLVGLTGFAAWSVSAQAQRAQNAVATIGFVAPVSPIAASGFIAELRGGLHEHGFIDGQNVRIATALAEDPDALGRTVAELINSNVDLIVAWSTPAVAASKRATSTIPIVMVGIADPVGAKFVESLARPGANITGSTNLSRDLSGKMLEFLLQIAPSVLHLGVLLNPSNEAAALQLRDTEVAIHTLRLQLHLAEVVNARGLASAVEKLIAYGATALLALPDPLFTIERARIAELALANKLPSVFARRENAEAGGLFSYGPNLSQQFRGAAAYVAKILRGAAPGDLPVEQPTSLHLAVNLRTAKALGLEIPPSLIARADEMIE